jgi:transposase
MCDGTPRRMKILIAEIGVDMSVFPSHKHLCSWAGISPGNNESGGKRKPARTKKGNHWLRAILVECGQVP